MVMARKQDALEDDAQTILTDHDKDKDGKLSLVEIVDDREDNKEENEQFFKEADANNDGFLDVEEIPKFVAALQTEKTAEQKAQEAAKILMADHDTDKDGKLSMVEIVDDREDNKEENEKFFTEADANKDGFLDAEELPKFLEALNQPHKKENDDAQTMLADHDTDKDGKLSLVEIVDDREDTKEENEIYFAEADANKDGFLDLEELPKFLEALHRPHKSVHALEEDPKTILAEHDADKDGKLSLAEIVDDREDNKEENEIFFTEADANKDGFLDVDELAKFLAAVHQPLKSAAVLEEDPKTILAEHDTDKDGKLSLVEIVDDRDNEKEEMSKFFKEADANADGFIDLDELPNFMAILEKDNEEQKKQHKEL